MSRWRIPSSPQRISAYVVPYQNWEFCDWEESGQFGCDLLIQMPMLVTLRRLQKTEEYFSEEEIYRVGRDICRALIRCSGRNAQALRMI